MYLPSTEQCSGMTNSRNSPSVAAISRARAQEAALDQAKATANSDWLGLLSRSWQSYIPQGANVAIQALNSSPDINPVSAATGIVLSGPSSNGAGQATGVVVVSEGNPNGSNPAAGGSGAAGVPRSGGSRSRKDPGVKTSGAQVLPSEFVRVFNYAPAQKTYTGPLPPSGSVLSLVLGGTNRPGPIGSGSYPAPTPDPRFGYGGSCPTAVGVNAIPIGEPDYSTDSGVTAAGGGSNTGLWLLGLLGLAGLAYFSSDDKKGRG